MSVDVKALREFINHEWERIVARHRYHGEGVHVSGHEIMQEHTQLADTVIRRIVAGARDQGLLPEEVGLTIVALGGYGRAELNPHSDIDIMVLYDAARCPRSVLEPFASLLITTLWDVGFEVGHSVRTIREGRHAAWADMDSRTAMLEGRYITGSRRLYKQFERDIKTRAMRRGVRPFIDEKVQRWRDQMGDPNATVYVQEPDVKAGVGGLREVHIARWVARVRFGVWELPDLARHKILPESLVVGFEAALDFLWRTRNELHYLTGRRADTLTLQMQEQVAKGLGYYDHGRQLAEEQLMRDYFRHAHWIHECARIIIMQSRWEWSSLRRFVDRVTSKRIERNIILLRDRLRLLPDALEETLQDGGADRLLIRLFYHRARLGYPLSVMTRHQIVATMPVLERTFRGSETVLRTFLKILAAEENIGDTVRDMHHLGALRALIPEFEHLRALVRYDLYHRYTVDEHTFVAISNLHAGTMEDVHHGATLARVFSDLEPSDRMIVRFAALLHDIGKGSTGDAGHVEEGSEITRQVLGRFPMLTDEQKADIQYLVEHHLLMSHTAQRRDLDDPLVIERFANEVGSARRARLLYLLTYADIRAVNPDLWTDWTATLLNKLFVRTEHYFRGEFRLGPDEIEALRREVVKRLGPTWEDSIREHMALMGDERMSFFSIEEIVAQVRAVSDLRENRACVLRVFAQSENFSSAIFAAEDRIGLFAQVAGVLAAADVNILSADLNTRRDRIAVDTIHIADAKTGLSIDHERASQLHELLEKACLGSISVEDLLTERRTQRREKTHRTLRMAPIVRVNNDDSRDYTILDVRAQDRVGLLYTITSTLSRLGLDISLAKISTEAYRAVDVFYIADEKHRKIRDPERLRSITETLRAALEE